LGASQHLLGPKVMRKWQSLSVTVSYYGTKILIE